MLIRSHRVLVALLLVAQALVAACGASGPAPDSPAGVVTTAVAMAAAKDVAGLSALACAGQQQTIQQLISAPLSLGAGLLPGLDLPSMMAAVRLDASSVKVGQAVVTGDEANVPVSGSVKVTFDKATMKPIVQQLMAARGTPMSSDQLDALLQGLADYGQDVPIDQQLHLVREQGAWRICQSSLGPLPSIGFPISIPSVVPGAS
jgi:hypothetical protein